MKKNIKYISILITIIFIFVSFVGCSSENPPEEQTLSNITSTSAKSVEHSKSTEQTSQTKKAVSESTTQNSNSEQNKSTAATSATNSTTKSTITTKKTDNKTTAAKTETTTAATTSSTISCSIEIECKKILSNMENLKAGHEDFVPADGIIMNTKTVTVNNGSTAYDALKSACSKNGVTINAQNSAYGTYIKGFNNIDEFDCGRQSGWIYTVNGSSPPKSCDKYTISQGDAIVFSFVC